MLPHSLLFLCLFAALGGPALAEDASLQPEVVVTAIRVAQTVDATLADVSVITREDIEASVARDISDLLRLQAGVDIARTGGPGGQTSVFLRGTNNNHVLVLIDGVRVSSLNTGAFTWETLPLATIERIEIVRGPRASYWGSDAIGGVVQIFTRSLDGPRIALGFGSHGDTQADVGIGHRGEQGGYSLQAGARDYDGFPSQNENGFGYENRDHGLRNRHFSARADRQLGADRVEGTWVRSQGTVEFAGGDSSFTEQAVHAAWEGEIRPAWQHRLSFGQATEDYSTPVYFNRFKTRRNEIGWQNRISMTDTQQLIVGIDHVRETGENRDTFSNTPTYRESRSNTGVYAGWQVSAAAFTSEAALRADDNSLFGRQTTGSLATGWRFSEHLRAYASHGLAFRGPTLNEQYSPGFGGLFAGNPDLQPEESQSTELGIEFTPSPGHLVKGNVYSTRIRNLISFSGVDFRAENVATARIDGSELSYERQLGEWQLASSFTWQDPRNEDNGTPLLRRARQKFAGTLERALGDAVRVGAELIYSGSRRDVGNIELPGYTLVNLRASWAIAAQWKLRARIENLGDRDYELAHGYNTPGRSGFLEIVWSAN